MVASESFADGLGGNRRSEGIEAPSIEKPPRMASQDGGGKENSNCKET